MRLLVLKFTDSKLMASALLRFGVYHDLAKYRGQDVSFADAQTFVDSCGGYPGGYNLTPSEVITASTIFTEPLNGNEQYVLTLLDECQPSYLIAYDQEGWPLQDTNYHHELAHASYFQSSSYRALVASIWNDLDPSTREAVEARFARYDRPRVVDEFQAYLYSPGLIPGVKISGKVGDLIHDALPKWEGEVAVSRIIYRDPQSHDMSFDTLLMQLVGSYNRCN